MDKPFFADESMLIFINNAPISDDDKTKLLRTVSSLDNGQRLGLLEAIRDIYLLDLEEKEQVKKLEKMMSIFGEKKEGLGEQVGASK